MGVVNPEIVRLTFKLNIKYPTQKPVDFHIRTALYSNIV